MTSGVLIVAISIGSLIISLLALTNSYLQRREARDHLRRAAEREFLVDAMHTVYRFNIHMSHYQQTPYLLGAQKDEYMTEVSRAMGRLRSEAWAWTGSPVFPLLDAIYSKNVDLSRGLRAWKSPHAATPGDALVQLSDKALAVMSANIEFSRMALRRLQQLAYPQPTTAGKIWRFLCEGPWGGDELRWELPVANPDDPYEGFDWGPDQGSVEEDTGSNESATGGDAESRR